MARQTRFTQADMLDAQGYFDANAANVGSRDSEGRSLYSGPQVYPRMYYHPKGEHRVVVPSSIEPTPVGPKEIPAKTELIHRIATNAGEAADLEAEGWHKHPALAVKAAGGVAPPMGMEQVMEDKDAEIAKLKAMLAAMPKQKLA